MMAVSRRSVRRGAARQCACAPPSSAQGTSLVEAVVALLLGLFLIHLGYSVILGLRTASETVSDRLDVLTASRITRSVLRREMARGTAGRDWVAADDSLRLRAFRGTAIVCSLGPLPSELVVAYEGDRRPEPAKDSVEVVGADGSLLYVDLIGAGPTSTTCNGADSTEVVMAWRIDGPILDDVLVVRLFESGSYHFARSALRYRVGAGGRQPLTPEVWRDSETGFLIGDSAVGVQLMPRTTVGRPVSEFLAWDPP